MRLKSILLLLLVGLVAGIIIWGVSQPSAKQHILNVLQWIQELGPWGPFFVTLFYIAACVFLLPGSILTLAAGFLFGVPIGFLSAWLGATLGACAAFLVGRTFGRDWIAAKVAGNPKFAAVDEAVGREGFKIVFLLRLSPVFPFNILNYALGLTKVSFRNYALASFLGMIPGGLMYVYFGSAARSLAEVASGSVEAGRTGQIYYWVGLVATIIVVTFITRVARKSLREAQQETTGQQPEQA